MRALTTRTASHLFTAHFRPVIPTLLFLRAKNTSISKEIHGSCRTFYRHFLRREFALSRERRRMMPKYGNTTSEPTTIAPRFVSPRRAVDTIGLDLDQAAVPTLPMSAYCFCTMVTTWGSVALFNWNVTWSPTAMPCSMAALSAWNCMVMAGQLIAAMAW